MVGAGVNAKKVTHEFWIEKISAEKLRIAEDQAKAAQKAANDARKMWAIPLDQKTL